MLTYLQFGPAEAVKVGCRSLKLFVIPWFVVWQELNPAPVGVAVFQVSKHHAMSQRTLQTAWSFKCSSAQMHIGKCSNTQMHKCTNAKGSVPTAPNAQCQMLNCTNGQRSRVNVISMVCDGLAFIWHLRWLDFQHGIGIGVSHWHFAC